MKQLEHLIYKTQLQLQLNALLKGLGIGIGMAFLLMSFYRGVELAVFTGALVTFATAIYFGALTRNREKAKKTLHLHYPELEYSLDILDKENRNMADHLQLLRLESQFKKKKAPLVMGMRLLPILLFLLGTGAIFGMSQMALRSGGTTTTSPEKVSKMPEEKAKEVLLESINIKIQPPAYTGLKAVTQQQLDITALEASAITWALDFNGTSISELYMIDGFGREIALDKKDKRFEISDRLTNSGIYAFKGFIDGEEVFQTDFHQMEMEMDRGPLIIPEEKDLYKYHFQNDSEQFELKARVSDDFLVREVYLIATLARGAGENVKFRERKFRLSQKNFQSATMTHEMDLAGLDFQPGDEVYYYWLAMDNKRPEANISRSETYFIQFVDSTGMTDSQLEGMAIHVLPDYFRSQRQIIIDTEKLIANQEGLSEEKFNEQSNELGNEQKLLRMRYGQYLGEEFESNAPGGTLNTAEGRDILEGFIHDHDQEGENEGRPALNKFRYPALQKYQEAHEIDQEDLKQQVEAMAGADEHQHQVHGPSADDELSSLLGDYLHSHDAEEENTFYEASTRSILKMALEMMWQSELHLRLFEPEQALPYQHKALEYLKSVQQKARTYVKKTGFDPPPIREEEIRLTGESEDLKTRYSKDLYATKSLLPLLASRILGLLHQEHISPDDQELIREFGELWTERLGNSGMQDWGTLLLLQKLSAQEIDPEEEALLSNTLQKLLDSERRNNQNFRSNEQLAKAFWENLE